LWADEAAPAFQIIDLVTQVVDQVILGPDASVGGAYIASVGVQSRPNRIVTSDGRVIGPGGPGRPYLGKACQDQVFLVI
jgi:hypothetical protein